MKVKVNVWSLQHKRAASTFPVFKVFPMLKLSRIRTDVMLKVGALLTDGGDVRWIELMFREPVQHASLPNPRVPEHEQPEQHVVLFSHGPKLKHRRTHDPFI